MYSLKCIRPYYFSLISGRRRESFWSTLILPACPVDVVVIGRYIMLSDDEKSGATDVFALPVYVGLTSSVLTLHVKRISI